MQIVEASPTASTLAAARRMRLARIAEASRQYEAKKRAERELAERPVAIEVAVAVAEPIDDAPIFIVRVPARWLDGMSMTVRKCVSAMASRIRRERQGHRQPKPRSLF
jgi:hypothetical protein